MNNPLIKTIIAPIVILFLSLNIEADPALVKPKVYNGEQAITGWLMSEKLDGIRAYWDGTQLLTRKGKRFSTPDWFLKNMPPFELDGELWSQRGNFENIQSIVMDQTPSAGWKQITYNLFEVPNADGNFTRRLKKAEGWFKQHPNKQVKIIPQIPCEGKEHLQTFLKEIESKGGEGVIVKDPSQPYHTGRSPHILKVKNFRDMEGKVIAIHSGQGKYAGMMGSLEVELENGIQFKIGTGFSNQERMNPPNIGEWITFKYYGFTKKGIPKFASFMHIRKD